MSTRTVSLKIGLLAPLAVAACLVAAASGGDAPGTSAAAAGGQNRAVVVVDTGGSVRKACVLFSEASISGLEALRRAGMSPVVEGFAGEGGAVCALNGVGCPADGSCLTCQAPSYWAYHRADGGGGYAYSSAGAGSTRVTDGDVEGWRWGTGAAPPLVTVDSVCGAEAPPATAPPSGGTGGSGAAGGGSGGGGGGGAVEPFPTPEELAAAGTTTTIAADGSTTTTTAAEDTYDDGGGSERADGGEAEGDGEQAQATIEDDDGGGGLGTVGSAGLATAALGGLGFFIWRARHQHALAGAADDDLFADPDPDAGPEAGDVDPRAGGDAT